MFGQNYKKRVIGFASVLLAPFISYGAQANDDRGFRAYANSSYGFCDAKKVALVWGRDIGQAKAVIGNKILSRLTHLIDQDIASTRNTVRCSWIETDLSFRDAEKLGRYWGRTTYQAKQKAARMISEMGTKRFREVMRRALRG